ncbi:MFS general substrate transporter [Lentinus tigrinus ALCF2SS1-6]|uniref:MFS general substrate transporter n=1 Tax=Lentinus tigrinus ALCF2SS1-6 TaxID=1328759 RepID=A0A5C2RPT5_9APHY|nr:MFS general substrate transporter [Lentinus tigrinus ALCF2SS1-6]
MPDGGLRAWLVILGVATGVCATFRLVNAWGVFQAYYEETLLQNSSPSNIAWIGSIQYTLNFLPGLAIGRLFDMGWFFTPLCGGSLLLLAATFLIGECTRYCEFLLCQGFAVGLSCGIIFNVILGTPAHWFKRRLGLALGFSSISSSIGGHRLPHRRPNTHTTRRVSDSSKSTIGNRYLSTHIRFKWTMRMLGLIEMCIVEYHCRIRRRLSPNREPGPFIDLRAFASAAYMLYCAADFVAFLGFYTVLTYIDVSATEAGIPSSLSFYLVAIANGCSLIGRIAGGVIADKTGPLTVMIPATFINGILTFAWPFAKSTGAYIAIAVIYGMVNGVFVSLVPGPIMQMGRTQRIGVLVGMSSTIMALGAVAGPPISGAINSSTGGFKFVGIYAG